MTASDDKISSSRADLSVGTSGAETPGVDPIPVSYVVLYWKIIVLRIMLNFIESEGDCISECECLGYYFHTVKAIFMMLKRLSLLWRKWKAFPVIWYSPFLFIHLSFLPFYHTLFRSLSPSPQSVQLLSISCLKVKDRMSIWRLLYAVRSSVNL